MSEEKESINLFLRADDKISRIQSDVTELMKKDLGLENKMDLIVQQQSQLKERFDYSSQTGHKVWESVQKMSALLENMGARITLAENKADLARLDSEKNEKKFDKYILGIGITVFCSILLTVMAFLIKWKP